MLGKNDSHGQPGVTTFLHLLWLLFLVVSLILYYYWNIPLQRAMKACAPLGTALFFLLSFCGWGSVPASRIAASQDRGLQFLTSAALGIGLTGLLVFVLGLAGLLDPRLFKLWSFSGFVLFLRMVYSWRPLRWNPGTSGPWKIFAAGVLGLFAVTALPFVVTPELTTDALEFHLLVPKLYLWAGKIQYLPLFVESNYPSLAEYNYLLLLALTDEVVCKAFHFWIGILLLFLLGKICRKLRPQGNAILGPAIFISMPVAAIVAGWAWNDFLYTLYLLLCLYFLREYQITPPEERRSRLLAAAGIMAGLASWTKYTFAIFALTLPLISFWGIYKWKWNIRKQVFLYLPIGAIASLWLLKNWHFTGNPFYPFLNEIFQSPYWTEAANRYFRGTLTRYEFPDWNWTHYFLFPFFIALKPKIADVHIGILPLALLPLVFRKTTVRNGEIFHAYIAFYMLIWVFVQTEVRSLFSVLAIICCLGAAGLQHTFNIRHWSGKLVLAALGLTVISNFYMTSLSTYYLFDPLKHFFGRETRSAYRTRLEPHQIAYDYLNSEKTVRKVLLIGLHGPFYLNHPSLFSSCCDPPLAQVLSANSNSSAQLAEQLRNQGVTHAAIDLREYREEHEMGLYSWTTEERVRFEAFVEKHCTKKIRYGELLILELADAANDNGRNTDAPR